MNIHVQPLGQPTPGSARPGNLYADLQSRTLWLGVSLDVHPSGSVLVSDMLAMMEQMTAGDEASMAYTEALLKGDSGLEINPKGYSGRDHKHTAADITDFTGAVQLVVTAMPGLSFNKGTVLMFTGDPTDIGVDEWVGWALCNGENGTPNLSDRFVMGYSGLPGHGMNQVNAPTTAATNEQGAHTHPVSNATLTLAQIPSHQHGPGTLKGVTTGSITAAGAHNHFITCTSVGGAGAYRPMLQQSGNSVNVFTETEPNHSHGITALDVTLNSGLSLAAGSSQPHSHPPTTGGAHTHTLSTANLREAVPFYALAFVVKL